MEMLSVIINRIKRVLDGKTEATVLSANFLYYGCIHEQITSIEWPSSFSPPKLSILLTTVKYFLGSFVYLINLL